jgi:hypothetical protein
MAKPQYGLVGTKPKKTGIPLKVGPITAQVPMPDGFGNFAAARAAANVAAKPPANPFGAYYDRVLSALQTPAQIEAQARRTALYNERATLAAQKAASDRIIGQYNDQSARAQGFARALAKAQGTQDEQAFGRYSDAASRLGGLGAGLTGAVSDAYQGDVSQATEAINRLTGGAGEISGVPSADAIRNASTYMGVTVPAGSLQKDAVNAARLAQSDAAARSNNIGLIAKGYSSRADDAIEQAASDARATIGGRGAAIQQAIDSLTGNRSNVLNTLGSVLSAKTSWQQQQTENAAARRKEANDAVQRMIENARAQEQLGITKSYLNNTLGQTQANLTGLIPGTNIPTYAASQDATQTAQTNQRLANEAERINHVKYDPQTLQPMLDKNGRPIPSTGYKIGPNGTVVAQAKPGTAAGRGGMSGTAWQELITNANEQARLWAKGAPGGRRYVPPRYDAAGKIVGGNQWIDDENAPATPALPYSAVLTQLNSLSAAPGWGAQAKKIANALFPQGTSDRGWDNPRATARELVKKAKSRNMSSDQVLAAAAAGNIPIDLVRAAMKAAGWKTLAGPTANDLLGLDRFGGAG